MNVCEPHGWRQGGNRIDALIGRFCSEFQNVVFAMPTKMPAIFGVALWIF